MCSSNTELNTPKLDNRIDNQKVFFLKEKARKELKLMKEKQTDATKPRSILLF